MKYNRKITIRSSTVLVAQHNIRAIVAMVHAVDPELAVFQFDDGLQPQDGLFVPWGDFLAHGPDGLRAFAAAELHAPHVVDQVEAP